MRWLVLVALAACDGSHAPITTGMDACLPDRCTPFVQNEGGNLIFSSMTFDTELQQALSSPPTAVRAVAYFMDAQTPDVNPLPVAGQCNNLVATHGWPWFVGTPHLDLDVGTVAIAGPLGTLPVPRLPGGTDALGRHHDVFYQELEPNADAVIRPDASYTVQFGGSSTIPATTFTDALFVPARFDVPDLESNGPLVAGTDFVARWTPATSTHLPPGDDVVGAVWLADANGSLTHLCVTLHSSGQFTIPGTAITELKQIAAARGTQTNRAIVVREALVHQLARLPNNEPDNQRRIDMIGAFSYAQLVDVQ